MDPHNIQISQIIQCCMPLMYIHKRGSDTRKSIHAENISGLKTYRQYAFELLNNEEPFIRICG